MTTNHHEWRKSTHSNPNGCCVHTRTTNDRQQVRDTKHPYGPTLTTTHTGWAQFITSIRNNDFER